MKQPTSVEQALDATLAALKERNASQSRLSQQLAHVIMRLADNDRRPSWPVVVSFTDKLTRELIGSQLNSAQITTIRDCIIGVMRRAGTSTAGLASRLQQTLAGLGKREVSQVWPRCRSTESREAAFRAETRGMARGLAELPPLHLCLNDCTKTGHRQSTAYDHCGEDSGNKRRAPRLEADVTMNNLVPLGRALGV